MRPKQPFPRKRAKKKLTCRRELSTDKLDRASNFAQTCGRLPVLRTVYYCTAEEVATVSKSSTGTVATILHNRLDTKDKGYQPNRGFYFSVSTQLKIFFKPFHNGQKRKFL